MYEGTLPCVDCKGIKTSLTLKADKTFTIKEEYLGKKGAVTENQGTINWEENSNIISLCPNTKDTEKHFIVKEKQLIMLNTNKKEIKGELAKHYIFNKK